MAHTSIHTLKSINISIKWIAWPVFLLSVIFLIQSFYNFIYQYPSVEIINVQLSFVWFVNLTILLVLCLFNWWLETCKWKKLTSTIGTTSFRTAAHSVFMGCSFGFITPNRIGDYAGRTIPFDKSLRPQLITLNAVSGFAQFLAVVIIGIISLLFYHVQFPFVSPAFIATSLTVISLTAIMFVVVARYPQKCRKLFLKVFANWSWISRAFSFQPLSVPTILMVLFISFVRAAVFTVQLLFVLMMLVPDINLFDALMAGGVYFAVLTVSPSLIFNKLGIREALSVLILTPVTFSPVAAAVAVFMLWFINQVIPVLLGSILLMKRSVQS